MKKLCITAIAIFYLLAPCFSQDLITTKAGEDIKAKVLEVGETQVRYVHSGDTNGLELFIPKSEISMILYENGTKDIFNQEAKAVQAVTKDTTWGYLNMKGQSDAVRYYKGYRPAAIGTLVVSLISPLAGLIPAITCSVVKPKKKHLNFPDPELMKMEAYHTAYTQRAANKKRWKIWSNWGFALTVNIVIVVALSTQH